MTPPNDALREALGDAAATLAAVRATTASPEWSESQRHFYEHCGETIARINAALAQPPASPGVDREAVGRIIDPVAFTDAYIGNRVFLNGDGLLVRRRARRAAVLVKADAILALLRQPDQGEG